MTIAITKRERSVRLSLDVPPELHKRLRIRAIQEDRTMTGHVIHLVEKDLDRADAEDQKKK